MGYQPVLIGDFKTGIQTDKQPWLIPDDAQQELLDGYIEHGMIHKRDGYNFFAKGEEGGMPYCESRMVRTITLSGGDITGAIDGANQTYTINTTTVTDPVRRGGFRVIGSNPVQTIFDNGEGGTAGTSDGTIDTALTSTSYYAFPNSIDVTFTTAPAVASTVTAEVDYHPGNPVMMVAQFVTANNTRQMIVADTQFLNRYNSSTNRLDDITNRVYTGDETNFFHWVQYPKTDDSPRLIFTNNVNPIQYYDGTNVDDFIIGVGNRTTVTGEIYGSGDGTTGPYVHTAANAPLVPGSISIVADPGGTPQTVTDDGFGLLEGDGSGTVDYQTGEISVTFNSNVPAAADNITIDYEYYAQTVTTCLLVFNYKDRLILMRTTETGGTIYPQRIRISGTGQSGDYFDNELSSATGAGVIDIPDQDWIMGASFNRDDLIIYTERATWILKYTGNDIVPFSLERIDGSRGSRAPYTPISYLNMTKAYSPYGFTVTDGYQVERFDQRIPDYCFENINQQRFGICFSGVQDDERMHYLIHPTSNSTTSDRILANNYEEQTFSVYRIPLSCMGNYLESFDITWNDLLRYDSWDAFAADYRTWNNIGYNKDSPISIGGGHEGEVWRLNVDSSEDNPLKIWNITTISTSPLIIQVTCDWHNYQENDYVYFTGVQGATELNDKVGYIRAGSLSGNNTFNVQFSGAPDSITTYTGGGTIVKVINFEMTTKDFNPYVANDVKVRCGWIYFYIEATQPWNTLDEGTVEDAKLTIEVWANDHANAPIQINSTNLNFKANATNFDGRGLTKRWAKVFINHTAQFLQFKIRNRQPGAQIRIHAIKPGFAPVGRQI